MVRYHLPHEIAVYLIGRARVAHLVEHAVHYGSEKVDRHRADYARSLLYPDNGYTAKTAGANTPELKQRKEITCELLFIEIVAVGFLGIASVLFKEKQMGVIRVHAILPLKKCLFILSKVIIFLSCLFSCH